jgi:hypothetical protein
MGHRHDPCLLDVLISAKRFLEGEPAKLGGVTLTNVECFSKIAQRTKANEIRIYDYLCS